VRRGKGEKTGRDLASERDLAEKTGMSASKARRAVKRADALGTATLEAVTATSLDKPGDLDALSVPETERTCPGKMASRGSKAAARLCGTLNRRRTASGVFVME
jgi:hypothetical protein